MSSSDPVQEFASLLALTPGPEDRQRLIKKAEMLAVNRIPEAGFGLLGQRQKLGALFRDGVPEPSFLPSPMLGERLFYAGHMFLFAGHKKAGKSWAMTLQARDMIAAGEPVVYIDNENGAELFTERLLLAGGLTWQQVDEHLHYVPFPRDMGSPDTLQEQFDDVREAVPGAFVVLDSLRSVMSRFGLNPEKNVEVERVLGPIMASVKGGEVEGRLTVGVIDHSNRNTSGKDDYVASGAAGKAQAVDAVYFFEKVHPFSRDVQGTVRIAVKDDRRGLLDFDRFYRAGGQGKDMPFYFAATDADQAGTLGRILLDVRQYVADQEGQMLTKTQIRKDVKGDNTTIDKSLQALVDDPSIPMFAISEGRKPPRYLWDEKRVVESSGLDV